MKEFLREPLLRASSDPETRYMYVIQDLIVTACIDPASFLSAPNSRAALRISAAMFKFLFSYHQVMPSFLDFVFPFGKQVLPQDVHFSGLRENSQLEDHTNSIGLAQLGRSGTALQLCYNLRSVEPSNDNSLLPWSIRQAAICHQFDLKMGTATWIIIKANDLIKKRLFEATHSPSQIRPLSRSGAFSATLDAHLLMCEWAGENWRWYFNDLEKEFQKLTGGVFATQAEKEPAPSSPMMSHSLSMSPRSLTSSFPLFSRAPTMCNSPPGSPTPTVSRFTPSAFSRTRTAEAPSSESETLNPAPRSNKMICGMTSRDDDAAKNLETAAPGFGKSMKVSLTKLRTWTRHKADESSYTLPKDLNNSCPLPNQKYGPQEYPPAKSDQDGEEQQEEFSFADLQRIQYIEEKAQETHLVIGSNVQILIDLRQHYRSLVDQENFPMDLRRDCQRQLSRFDRCVLAIEKDLHMLQARIQNLLDRLANRKNLVRHPFHVQIKFL